MINIEIINEIVYILFLTISLKSGVYYFKEWVHLWNLLLCNCRWYSHLLQKDDINNTKLYMTVIVNLEWKRHHKELLEIWRFRATPIPPFWHLCWQFTRNTYKEVFFDSNLASPPQLEQDNSRHSQGPHLRQGLWSV